MSNAFRPLQVYQDKNNSARPLAEFQPEENSKTILIFGASQSGKTTIVNLLSGANPGDPHYCGEGGIALKGCTFESCVIANIPFNGGTLNLIDTVGTGEAETGTVRSAESIKKLIELCTVLSKTGLTGIYMVKPKGAVMMSEVKDMKLMHNALLKKQISPCCIISKCDNMSDISIGRYMSSKENIKVMKDSFDVAADKFICISVQRPDDDLEEDQVIPMERARSKGRSAIQALIQRSAFEDGVKKVMVPPNAWVTLSDCWFQMLGLPFRSINFSSVKEMFVGVGASRVRDLFRQAKEKAPAIIFIDEIDAIGRARGRSIAQGANDERENTLNQLLTEMDGFGTNSGVIILAATNRADILDRALMRAGRFDRQIYVDMPDVLEREEIFKVHLKPLKLDKTVDISFLAKQTPGFSGADIANICNEAALIAARKDKKSVDRQDFLDAVDRIIGGLEKKNKIISAEEKKVIAYHEAGHASVSWLLEHASPLVKVTIVPRGRSLGAAWYLPEERQITTKEQLLDEMCAALGGRAAEETIFGKVSTGALSDLEKITKQAYAMVTMYGLNEKIGNISYYDSSGQSEYMLSKPYSEETAKVIDEEVSKMIEAAYVKTKKILGENKEKLSQLADLLLEREVIFLKKIWRKFLANVHLKNRNQTENLKMLQPK